MDIKETIKVDAKMSAQATMNATLKEHLSAPVTSYKFECFGPREECREEYLSLMAEARHMDEVGLHHAADALIEKANALVEKKWEEDVPNTVTNVGRNDVLDKYFKGSSYTAAWYLGLKGTGSVAAGDTLASHAGWAEVTPYTGNRKTITWGTTSSQSNTASAASFAITGSATVAGGFIASVNSGTSGILYSASNFASSRTVANGDTLNVTPTVSD